MTLRRFCDHRSVMTLSSWQSGSFSRDLEAVDDEKANLNEFVRMFICQFWSDDRGDRWIVVVFVFHSRSSLWNLSKNKWLSNWNSIASCLFRLSLCFSLSLFRSNFFVRKFLWKAIDPFKSKTFAKWRSSNELSSALCAQCVKLFAEMSGIRYSLCRTRFVRITSGD